jgi:porin
VTQGLFTDRYRANQAGAGLDIGPSETDVELTYADKIGERVTLQPDLQWIHRPSGNRDVEDALVVGLRLTVEL